MLGADRVALLSNAYRPTWRWNFVAGAIPPGATFTRASAGWSFNSAGVLTSAGNNIARFDYDPATLSPLGYLAEMQSTNAITQSQKLTDATWGATALTVTDNAQTSPDGTANASTLLETATTNTHVNTYSSVSIVSGSVYGVSCFVKNITGSRWVELNVGGAAGFSFRPSDGTTGQGLGGNPLTSFNARQLANGWWRISAFFTAAATTTTDVRLYLANSSSVNAPSYAGDGTSTIAAFGFQFETAGVGVTSYIPTAGATVTRSADILSLPLTSLPGWNASKGGVLVATYRLHTIRPSGVQSPASIADAVGNNAAELEPAFSGGNPSMDVFSGGARQARASGGATVPTFTRSKIAGGWSTSRVQIAMDGALLGTASGTYSLPVSPTNLYAGTGNASADSLNGAIESIAYYAGARSDSFVQGVSR